MEHKRASQCQENSETQDIVAVLQVQHEHAPFSALSERSPMSENRYGVISGMRNAEDRQLAIARLASEGIPTDRIFRSDPEEPNAPPVWLSDLSAGAELIAPSLSDLNLSTQGIAATVEAARELGIHIRCLDEAFNSRNDWQSQIGTLLTALNRLDRKGFSDRTKIALQEAKARGQRLGRKPSMTDLRKAVAIQMIEAGYKGTKIWKTLAVLEGPPISQSAYYLWQKTWLAERE
ncbi:recombinase family protein [Celeribacter sp.]|uniref:recombinase family protein n=1 Tax=Celeribacter sp. TaxID=1890673 RepID=UPI003A95DE27